MDQLAWIGDEALGQVGTFDSNQRAGASVPHELLRHWDRYRDAIPGSQNSMFSP